MSQWSPAMPHRQYKSLCVKDPQSFMQQSSTDGYFVIVATHLPISKERKPDFWWFVPAVSPSPQKLLDLPASIARPSASLPLERGLCETDFVQTNKQTNKHINRRTVGTDRWTITAASIEFIRMTLPYVRHCRDDCLLLLMYEQVGLYVYCLKRTRGMECRLVVEIISHSYLSEHCVCFKLHGVVVTRI